MIWINTRGVRRYAISIRTALQVSTDQETTDWSESNGGELTYKYGVFWAAPSIKFVLRIPIYPRTPPLNIILPSSPRTTMAVTTEFTISSVFALFKKLVRAAVKLYCLRAKNAYYDVAKKVIAVVGLLSFIPSTTGNLPSSLTTFSFSTSSMSF